MIGALIEWGSGLWFYLIFGGGFIFGFLIAAIVVGANYTDVEHQHEEAIRALRRIYLGLRSGWPPERAVDEAAQILYVERADR